MCSSQFVYLRDNKLANLAGIEILKNVKVNIDIVLGECNRNVKTKKSSLINIFKKHDFYIQVLDLSSNELKGYGLEPLANCKALQVSLCFVFSGY